MSAPIRGIVRRHSVLLIAAGIIIVVDQISKAIFATWYQWDPGWSVLSPAIGGMRVISPVAGAWADALGLVLLVAAWVWTLRRSRGWTSVAATVLLAGITSNALDRLGLSSLVAGSGGRGVPNFYGWWNFGNVADPVIYCGGMALLACGVAGLVRFERSGEPVRVPRLSMRRVIAVVAIGVALFAGALAWTTTYAAMTTNKPIALGVSEPISAQAVGVGL